MNSRLNLYTFLLEISVRKHNKCLIVENTLNLRHIITIQFFAMSSRPVPTSKSLYIPSATKSSGGNRSNDSKPKYSQDQNQTIRRTEATNSKKIVILERSGLSEKVTGLLKDDRCWIIDEIQTRDFCRIKPLKIMDEGLQMSKLDYSFPCNNEFTVVGVVGFEGVGKSTILSKLAGEHLNPFKTSKSGELGTLGLEMYITPERVILLDSQPVNSSMVLEKLKIKKCIPPSFSRRAHLWNEILSKRLTALLWSVCNVLLVVIDENTFLKMFEFLKSIDNRGFRKNAKVIFIYNKSSGSNFKTESYQKLIQEASIIPGLNWENQDSCNLKSFYPDLYSKVQDSNVFLLPFFSEFTCNLSLKMSLESLNAYRKLLMGVPNDFRALFYQFRIGLMEMIPLKNQITEKEWIKNTMESWEEISRIKWPL